SQGWNRYYRVSLEAAVAEDANFIQYHWGTVGRAGCHRGGAPSHLRDDLQRQPCQFRATEHPLSAPRCRGGIRPSAREVQGRQRGREIETRPTLIVVKEQDKWQIVAFQNTKISEVPAAAQAAARLAT